MTSGGDRRLRALDHSALILLAAVVTLLNAFKPIMLDDAVYYIFATHIADHPLDPYGFKVWDLEDANRTLAPPGFLFWCAIGIRLFGSDPFVLKLWLLPINLLLVYSLHSLGRRFANGMATLFVFFVVTSAAVMPCVNLMLDVPSLAVALAAIVLFMQACDERSLIKVATAGLIAGFAMETKYTAFTAPAAMLLYSATVGRLPLGLLALSVAGGLFLGWEGFIKAKYGDSHFWLGAMQYSAPPSAKLRLLQPFFGLLGGLIPFLLPTALVVLGKSPRLVRDVTAVLAIGFALLALPDSLWPDIVTPRFTAVQFGIVGLAITVYLEVSAERLIARTRASGRSLLQRFLSPDGFLIAWILLEVASYFALSPYAAARRMMGVMVASSLVVFRLASKTSPDRKRLLWTIAALSAAHGLFLAVVDDNWWRGRMELAKESARVCRAEDPNAVIWYFGDTAFDHYASRQGMKRLIFVDAIPAPGDWIVVEEGFEEQFKTHGIHPRCIEAGSAEWRSRLPIKSQFQASSVPIARWDHPGFMAKVYRVK